MSVLGRAMRSAIHEILALFIDDGLYAFAIVTWVTFIALITPRLRLPITYETPVFTVGLLAIVVLGVRHAAHRIMTRGQ
jgi:hypothetical protein